MSTMAGWLREIVRCPACRSTLQDGPDRLVCTGCGLRYPIVDGIPVLLVSDAEPAETPADGAERG